MCVQYSTLDLCLANHPHCLARPVLCADSFCMCMGVSLWALVTDPSLTHACHQVVSQRAPAGIPRTSPSAGVLNCVELHWLMDELMWRHVNLLALHDVRKHCGGKSGRRLKKQKSPEYGSTVFDSNGYVSQ